MTSSPRYEIRAALPGDESELSRLAKHLNSVNLPDDAAYVKKLLSVSQASFTGTIEPSLRRYVFALWDLEKGCAVGTSSLIAQLGRRDAPYIYFSVFSEEKYSRTLDRHFYHTLLRLCFSYDGPTEIGGLVVAPSYRGDPARLGLTISAVRFLFLAAHRDLFRDELLAELLPPLEPDGTSHLWEALGRHFTGQSYLEADLLSSENKDFIRDLFPTDVIYVNLLDPQAQAVIGKVGSQTQGVERLLKRLGFKYASRVDPFDGGPHFTARTEEVTFVQNTRRAPLTTQPLSALDQRGLVAREYAEPPYFRAVPTEFALMPDGAVVISEATADHLEIEPGAELVCLPIGA
jgi:arginine N-succinyltransferase